MLRTPAPTQSQSTRDIFLALEEMLAELREMITVLVHQDADEVAQGQGALANHTKIQDMLTKHVDKMVDYQNAVLIMPTIQLQERLLRTYLAVIQWFEKLIPLYRHDLSLTAGINLKLGQGIAINPVVAQSCQAATYVLNFASKILAPPDTVDLAEELDCKPERDLKSGTLEAELFIAALNLILTAYVYERNAQASYPRYLLGLKTSYFIQAVQELRDDCEKIQDDQPGLSIMERPPGLVFLTVVTALAQLKVGVSQNLLKDHASLATSFGINAYYEGIINLQIAKNRLDADLQVRTASELILKLSRGVNCFDEAVKVFVETKDLELKKELLKYFTVILPTYKRLLVCALDFKEELTEGQLGELAQLLPRVVAQVKVLTGARGNFDILVFAPLVVLEFMECYAELLAKLPDKTIDLINCFGELTFAVLGYPQRNQGLNIFPMLEGVANLLQGLSGNLAFPSTQIALLLQEYPGTFEAFKLALGAALNQTDQAYPHFVSFIALILELYANHSASLPNFKNRYLASLLANPQLKASLLKYLVSFDEDLGDRQPELAALQALLQEAVEIEVKIELLSVPIFVISSQKTLTHEFVPQGSGEKQLSQPRAYYPAAFTHHQTSLEKLVALGSHDLYRNNPQLEYAINTELTPYGRNLADYHVSLARQHGAGESLTAAMWASIDTVITWLSSLSNNTSHFIGGWFNLLMPKERTLHFLLNHSEASLTLRPLVLIAHQLLSPDINILTENGESIQKSLALSQLKTATPEAATLVKLLKFIVHEQQKCSKVRQVITSFAYKGLISSLENWADDQAQHELLSVATVRLWLSQLKVIHDITEQCRRLQTQENSLYATYSCLIPWGVAHSIQPKVFGIDSKENSDSQVTISIQLDLLNQGIEALKAIPTRQEYFLIRLQFNRFVSIYKKILSAVVCAKDHLSSEQTKAFTWQREQIVAQLRTLGHLDQKYKSATATLTLKSVKSLIELFVKFAEGPKPAKILSEIHELTFGGLDFTQAEGLVAQKAFLKAIDKLILEKFFKSVAASYFIAAVLDEKLESVSDLIQIFEEGLGKLGLIASYTLFSYKILEFCLKHYAAQDFSSPVLTSLLKRRQIRTSWQKFCTAYVDSPPEDKNLKLSELPEFKALVSKLKQVELKETAASLGAEADALSSEEEADEVPGLAPELVMRIKDNRALSLKAEALLLSLEQAAPDLASFYGRYKRLNKKDQDKACKSLPHNQLATLSPDLNGLKARVVGFKGKDDDFFAAEDLGPKLESLLKDLHAAKVFRETQTQKLRDGLNKVGKKKTQGVASMPIVAAPVVMAPAHPGAIPTATPLRLFPRPRVALTAATSSSSAYLTHNTPVFNSPSKQKLFAHAAIHHLSALRPALTLPDTDLQLVVAYHLWRIFACLNEYLKLGGLGSDNFTANTKYLQDLREMTDKYGYFYVDTQTLRESAEVLLDTLPTELSLLHPPHLTPQLSQHFTQMLEALTTQAASHLTVFDRLNVERLPLYRTLAPHFAADRLLFDFHTHGLMLAQTLVPALIQTLNAEVSAASSDPRLSMLINLCGRCFNHYNELNPFDFTLREAQWLETWKAFLKIAKTYRNQVEHSHRDVLTPELKDALKRLSVDLAKDESAMLAVLTKVSARTRELISIGPSSTPAPKNS